MPAMILGPSECAADCRSITYEHSGTVVMHDCAPKHGCHVQTPQRPTPAPSTANRSDRWHPGKKLKPTGVAATCESSPPEWVWFPTIRWACLAVLEKGVFVAPACGDTATETLRPRMQEGALSSNSAEGLMKHGRASREAT